MRLARHALALFLGSLLAACITPPNVAPLEKPVDRKTDLGLKGAPAQVADSWWAEYHDSQLDRLVNDAVAENPTLEQTLARLRLAQATVDATRSALWPSLSYDAGESRGRLSGKDVMPHPYAGTKVWRGSEQLNCSWELDFWGRQARGRGRRLDHRPRPAVWEPLMGNAAVVIKIRPANPVPA